MELNDYNITVEEPIKISHFVEGFDRWSLVFRDSDIREIRPDFYDYREVKLCYVCKFVFEDIDDLSAWDDFKDEYETELAIALRKAFKKEFMVKFVKDSVYICWEVEQIIPR